MWERSMCGCFLNGSEDLLSAHAVRERQDEISGQAVRLPSLPFDEPDALYLGGIQLHVLPQPALTRHAVLPIRATTNPGGIGHGWVKERFITPAPPRHRLWRRWRVQGSREDWGSCGGQESLCRPRYLTIRSYCGTRRSITPNLAMLPENERMALLYGAGTAY